MDKRNRHASKEKSPRRTVTIRSLCATLTAVVLLWIYATAARAEIRIDSSDESDSVHVVPDGERERISIDTPEDDDSVIMVRPPRPPEHNQQQPMIIAPEIHLDGHQHRRPDKKDRPFQHEPHPKPHIPRAVPQ